MSAISKAQVIAFLSEQSPAELQELLLELEDLWQMERPYSPAQVQTQHVEMGMPLEPDLVLLDPGPERIAVMKTLRTILQLPLKETRALLDAAPCVLIESIDPADAREIIQELESLGAKLELRR